MTSPALLIDRACQLADDDALDCESSDLELWRWALKARALLQEIAKCRALGGAL